MSAPRKRRTSNEIAADELTNRLFAVLASGVQINVLDIGKILNAGREAALAELNAGRLPVPAARAAVEAKLAELRKN